MESLGSTSKNLNETRAVLYLCRNRVNKAKSMILVPIFFGIIDILIRF
jgi:hypothetical protein